MTEFNNLLTDVRQMTEANAHIEARIEICDFIGTATALEIKDFLNEFLKTHPNGYTIDEAGTLAFVYRVLMLQALGFLGRENFERLNKAL